MTTDISSTAPQFCGIPLTPLFDEVSFAAGPAVISARMPLLLKFSTDCATGADLVTEERGIPGTVLRINAVDGTLAGVLIYDAGDTVPAEFVVTVRSPDGAAVSKTVVITGNRHF